MWSWDFVEDQTENGSRFRILTILDEHPWQSVALRVGWSIRAPVAPGLPKPKIAINAKNNHKQQSVELQI